MSKPDSNYGQAALAVLRQTGQVFHRVLDGLGRLGIIPWELLHLAAFCADFVLNLAAMLWVGAQATARSANTGTESFCNNDGFTDSLLYLRAL